MDLHQAHGLRRVINACGKMTALSAAVVRPEIIDVVAESLRHFFVLDELQAAAGSVIARATGAESGCVTACTAAGITLGVAACMTGGDLERVLLLPDTTGMSRRVLIQKAHCINFGGEVTQQIRLSGAEVVEVGAPRRTTPDQIRNELDKGGVAAIVAVESHHTAPDGWVRLPDLIPIAHAARVPVVVDGAAQDLRLRELVAMGSDLVLTSAHKFLCSTTAGIVAGRKDLVDAVYLQNRGIGRGMKAGKEAVFGAIAALEYRMKEDVAAWTAEQDRRVRLIREELKGIPGLGLSVDPDPNGCPFSRARLTPDPKVTGKTARALTEALAEGNPTVVARSDEMDEGYIHLDAIELTDDEIRRACEKVRSILAR